MSPNPNNACNSNQKSEINNKNNNKQTHQFIENETGSVLGSNGRAIGREGRVVDDFAAGSGGVEEEFVDVSVSGSESQRFREGRWFR